jgi:hypothetical protein
MRKSFRRIYTHELRIIFNEKKEQAENKKERTLKKKSVHLIFKNSVDN